MANASDVNSLLKWLNRIDNSDWLPPAILFLAQKSNEPDYVLWFFSKLERLAAYMHVCAKNVNERIEQYALVVAELQDAHSIQSPIGPVDLTANEKAEMLTALGGKIVLVDGEAAKLRDLATGLVPSGWRRDIRS